jgi:hypothetical protein
MSKSIRKILGKEQYELIKQRNWLMLYYDCSVAYGDNTMSKSQYEKALTKLNNKINSLKLLREALKQKEE